MLSRRSFLQHAASLFTLAALPFPVASFAASAPVSSTRLLMGTFVTINVSGTSEFHAREAMEQAFQEMSRLETLLTRHDSASPLGHLNSTGRLADCPAELLRVIQASTRLHQRSSGAFDPTVLPLLEARQQMADSHTQREAAALIGLDRVQLRGSGILFGQEGMKMSLDGIAKGHIADAGAAVLERLGIQNFLIDAGGDIVARGRKTSAPWKIAIQDPSGRDAYPAVCTLNDCAIATSGTYEQGQHIIDPTGSRSVSVSSATVIAGTAMEADSLATTLCILPDPIAFIDSIPGTACLIIQTDGRQLRSRNWPV